MLRVSMLRVSMPRVSMPRVYSIFEIMPVLIREETRGIASLQSFFTFEIMP